MTLPAGSKPRRRPTITRPSCVIKRICSGEAMKKGSCQVPVTLYANISLLDHTFNVAGKAHADHCVLAEGIQSFSFFFFFCTVPGGLPAAPYFGGRKKKVVVCEESRRANGWRAARSRVVPGLLFVVCSGTLACERLTVESH